MTEPKAYLRCGYKADRIKEITKQRAPQIAADLFK